MLVTSAAIARRQGDAERARRELTEARDRLRAHHGDGDARTREAAAQLSSLSAAAPPPPG